jgi:hypothetical protein
MTSYLAIIRVFIVFFCLFMADISFQKDAQELVLTPIENMIMKLEKISKI